MKKFTILGLASLLVAALVVPVLAAGGNVIRDPSFESNPRAGLHDIRAFNYNGIEGDEHASLFGGDAHTGRQSVLLQTTGSDYARSYQQVPGNKAFDDVTGFGFWFKHYGDASEIRDTTPYPVMVVRIEGGDYDGGELVVVHWNTWSGGYVWDWTPVSYATPSQSLWHYLIYDADGNYITRVGMPGGVPLDQIQADFDGTVERVAIAVGLAGGPSRTSLLVDDFKFFIGP